MKKISIMVPCYNEEENVVPLSEALIAMFEKERAQAVDSFREKYVHGNVMEADFEAMVNAIWNDDYEAHVLMFLYGAGEREKMLS